MREVQARSVPCEGALGRRGECTVVVRAGRAVLRTPPGEAAVMTCAELSEMIEVLCEARHELFRTES